MDKEEPISCVFPSLFIPRSISVDHDPQKVGVSDAVLYKWTVVIIITTDAAYEVKTIN